MPTLLAIIPEDGWAMVREDETIFFVRPPFRKSERVPVPDVTLADAVSLHGYEARLDAPEESWSGVVERIREVMARVHENRSLPSDGELLSRMLRSGPPSVLTGLLDRIENEWFATGDLRAAERALKALLAEDRVTSSKVLRDRALALRQRLDDLRDEREARAPARPRPPRIAEISRRPAVADYRSRLRGFGSASMVSSET
jgi:hypothetical protein